jgi:hypothetical protein
MAKRAMPLAVSNPLFNLLIIIVVGTGAAALLSMIGLAIWAPEPMTKAQERLLVICEYAFMTCLGAVVGLLGGRAARPDYLGHLPEGGGEAPIYGPGPASELTPKGSPGPPP